MLRVAEGKHRARLKCQKGRRWNSNRPTAQPPNRQTAQPPKFRRMFPYRDENPTEKPAIITVAIIIANALVFILIQGAGAQGPLARSVCELGLIPGELLHIAKPGSGVELLPGVACLVGVAPKYWTAITSMFTHGGWLHLIGNMLFLLGFRENILDAIGHRKFIVFYFFLGIAAGAAQKLLRP